MLHNRLLISFCLLLAAQLPQIDAFVLRSRPSFNAGSIAMAPKYNAATQRWEPTDPQDTVGYPPIGSLIRQGPLPFFKRLTNADEYEQGVLKMMATNNLTRNQAQGSFDAYLQNPGDWTLQKIAEDKGAPKYDYENANMEPKQLILTASWTSILLVVISRILFVTFNGCDTFCHEYHF